MRPVVRETERVHLYLASLPLSAFAVLVEVSVVAAGLAVYLAVRPPEPWYRPLMVADLLILTIFWIWHLIVRTRRRAIDDRKVKRTALSFGLMIAAVPVNALAIWIVVILETHR